MTFFSVLTLIGGLAMFLFGMQTMEDGLVKVSGGRLDSILESLTSSRFKGLLLGAVVTAIIQSSSATTVMVIGFVNSGIMKLAQAVGVIMGANVGTTMTSWLLSLTGIDGSSFFITLLKPSSFSPILALIGIILLMTAKGNSRRQAISSILLGFAVLMFGMSTMSGAVEPLAENESFTQILTMFSNPLLGVAAGAIVTGIIQSSSASIGILQAMCLTGVIPYKVAIPIIMGQNIGTCVTALISAIGAGKNAKRASMVHLYFNLIGTIVLMAVFYGLNAVIGFSFLNEAASVVGIAVVHTMFNVICCILWFPFGNVLVKLATLTIPDKETPSEEEEQKPGELAVLDERFLETPAYAVSVSWDASGRMASLAMDSVTRSIDLVKSYSEEGAKEILSLEQRVDEYQNALSLYLVKVGQRSLLNRDNNRVSIMLQCIRDFERISDHAANIRYAMDEMQEQGERITSGGKKELMVYAAAVQGILGETLMAYQNYDLTKAQDIEPFEEVIEELGVELRQRHVDRLRRGKCTLEAGLFLEDIITNLERIADHCAKIGGCMIRLGSEDNTRQTPGPEVLPGGKWFESEYESIKERYELPQRK